MSEARYYIRDRGRVRGPFDMAQLRALRDRGQFSSFHEVSEDRRVWMSAATLAQLFAQSGRSKVQEADSSETITPPKAEGVEVIKYEDLSSRRGRPDDRLASGGDVCSILSVIFGCVAFLLCPPFFGLAGFVLGIIGTVLGENKALGATGIFLSVVGGIVGMILGAVVGMHLH